MDAGCIISSSQLIRKCRDFVKAPYVIAYTGFLRQRDLQRFVNTPEVVKYVMKCYGVNMVFDLLAKDVGQPRKLASSPENPSRLKSWT